MECVCSTADCLKDDKLTCSATQFCYVQVMSGKKGGFEREVIRGCIDDRTPLLCENRRPQAYTGSWPVLHCCKGEYCNKDVMPTLPSYLADMESK